jgi:hypothetical protein
MRHINTDDGKIGKEEPTILVSRSRSTDAVSSYHGDEERDTSDPELAESGVHMYGDHEYLRCNEATEYVPLAFRIQE